GSAHHARLARLLGDRRQSEVGHRRAHSVAPPPLGTAAECRARGARTARRRDGVRTAPSSGTGRLMQDRPHAAELGQAVREFIETEVLPGIDDPRLRFRTLVAANALGILERELTLGAPLVRREVVSLARLLGHADPLPDALEQLRPLARDLNRDLALRIRADEDRKSTRLNSSHL